MRKQLLPLLFLILLVTQRVFADWPCESSQSVSVIAAPGNQWNVHLTTDGNMGAFMVWQDRRGGVTDKLYIQHVDGTGNMAWQGGGIPVSATAGYQYYPQIIPDGTGGMIVVWQDNRGAVNYDIYAQRISGNGTFNWAPGGTVVCNASGNQYNPQLASDGMGGVLITWQDYRSGNFDIYAQRLNGDGQPLWTPNGVAVCSNVSNQINPQLVGDGSGGTYIAWTDYRVGNGTSDIYCQHILANGLNALTADGIAICAAPNTQWNPQIVTDGFQGAILCWQDRRSGDGDKIYAQRLDRNGILDWTADGTQLANSVGIQYYCRLASDGSGGAVAVWQDNRTGTDYDIYSQRVDSTGRILWSSSGQPVSVAAGQQYNPQLVVDGQSVLATWQDQRNGVDYDIYAQRLNLNGVAQWSTNGTAIFSYMANQVNPQIVGDGIEGAIMAWADYRDGSGTTDIYAQRIGASGKLAGGCYRSFTQDSLALRAVRLSFNKYTPPRLPTAGNVRDSVFKRGAFPTGITVGISRIDSSRYYGWEIFNRTNNVRLALPESGIARPFDRLFNRKFIGGLRNTNLRVYNNRLVGELLALNVNIGASDVGITDSQFGDLVFSDPSDPTNVLNHRSLRQVVAYVDSLLTMWQWYSGINYRQIAASIHRVNEAFDGHIDTISTRPLLIKSTKALFSVPFLVPNSRQLVALPAFIPQPVDDDIPANYVLYQNYPNPFNPTTTIQFDLPQQAIVTLKVYNLLGQETTTLLEHVALDEGNQQVFFDASALSSGVYFYRLYAENAGGPGRFVSNVKKMLFLK